MSCINPKNQPIYQALLDRAASYPASMTYKTDAYRKAAESVRTWNYNLYKEHISVVPFVGESIQDFIYCFITTGVTKLYKTGNESIDNARRIAAMNDPMNAPRVPPPTPVPEVNQTINNTSSTNETTSIVSDVMTSLVRRSSRLQNKPKVQYYTSDDDSDVVDDDSDETYIDEEEVDEEDLDEREKVIQTIKDICTKKGWKYTDDLIDEYDAWRATATENYKIKKYIHLHGYCDLSEPVIAKRWATQFSDSLFRQERCSKISKIILSVCNKYNITYEDRMINNYISWYNNPDNKKHISRTLWRSKFTYQLSSISKACVNNWFATLKKTIVW